MENIQIYIATHKNCDLPKNKIYAPLLVGACYHKESYGFLRDDIGENISDKNPFYCELTGLYWIWKHSSAKIIGLCHYRRFLSNDKYGKSILEENDIFEYMQSYDLILPKKSKLFFNSVYDQYSYCHISNHLDIIKEIIHKLYPKYIKSFQEVFESDSAYFCSMFIGRKKVLDEYFEWLFPILEELEEYIDFKIKEVYYNLPQSKSSFLNNLSCDYPRFSLPYIYYILDKLHLK